MKFSKDDVFARLLRKNNIVVRAEVLLFPPRFGGQMLAAAHAEVLFGMITAIPRLSCCVYHLLVSLPCLFAVRAVDLGLLALFPVKKEIALASTIFIHPLFEAFRERRDESHLTFPLIYALLQFHAVLFSSDVFLPCLNGFSDRAIDRAEFFVAQVKIFGAVYVLSHTPVCHFEAVVTPEIPEHGRQIGLGPFFADFGNPFLIFNIHECRNQRAVS